MIFQPNCYEQKACEESQAFCFWGGCAASKTNETAPRKSGIVGAAEATPFSSFVIPAQAGIQSLF
jgi:hypothetical protein